MAIDRKDYLNKYHRENLKRVPLDMKLKAYEDMKAHAEGRGETINGFIKRAIQETMDRDNAPGESPDTDNL
ncbi:MAG: hypothetical protein IKQ49_00145 [Eubacterium sp.]|nr:hypothetical protein [Eubacterium sp.]